MTTTTKTQKGSRVYSEVASLLSTRHIWFLDLKATSSDSFFFKKTIYPPRDSLCIFKQTYIYSFFTLVCNPPPPAHKQVLEVASSCLYFFNSRINFHDIDVPSSFNQLHNFKKYSQPDPRQVILRYCQGWAPQLHDYKVLPVSVNDCISYVKSILTLSAFSTLRKIIPRNHIDT